MGAVECFELSGNELVPRPTVATTLNDLSLELPDGVYTSLRTYPGARVLHLDAHFDRLVASALLEGVPLSLDTGALRGAIAATLASAGFPLARMRVTVCLSPKIRIYVAAEQLHELPEEVYRSGVSCGIADRSLKRALPRSKSTRFIGPGAGARRTAPAANEVLLVSEKGEILEGSSSNFFSVLDGVLRTAEDGVLAGTTRATVLDVADGLLPIERRPVLVEDVARLQEAFVTSVGRAVLPVIAIGERSIGDGVPGPFTKELRLRFNRALEADLEPIVGSRAW
jgi:branched-chain amino acid aminotransferase